MRREARGKDSAQELPSPETAVASTYLWAFVFGTLCKNQAGGHCLFLATLSDAATAWNKCYKRSWFVFSYRNNAVSREQHICLLTDLERYERYIDAVVVLAHTRI